MSDPTPSHVRLARNTALSLVAIGLLGAARLAYNIVLGRRFDAATLGRATLAINAAMFATLLVSGGWQASTAKYLAQAIGRGEPAVARGIYRRTLRHNSGGGVVVAAIVAIALAVAPGIDLTTRDAILAGVVALSFNAYQHLKSAQYGFGAVATYLRMELIASGLMIAGLGAVAAAGARAAVLVPVAGSYVVFSVLAFAAGPRREEFALVPKPLWREIQGFTLLAIVGTVASAGFLNLSPVFAGRYDSPQALGVFSAALALVLPVYFFPRALSLALFPSIAYRYGEDRIDAVRAQMHQTGRALWIVLLAPVAVAAIGSRIVLRILFGDAYQSGDVILAIMLGATYLSVVQIPYVTTLSGTDRRHLKVPALASMAGFALGLIVWVTLGAREGATGIAWGYLIGSVPQAVIPIAYAARTFDVRVASTAARATVVWAFVAVVVWRAGDDLGRIGPALAASAGCLIVYGALFGRDIRDIVRTVRGRAGSRAGGGAGRGGGAGASD